MKTNKLWKRFWTLNVHDHAGFTLVELIVVIAILAILAAVAIPAYSGYIEKTNKTLDETLISEVKRALELARYSNEITTDGQVVLCYEGEPAFSSSEYQNAILTTFGSTEGLALKYNGWVNDNFQGSSFQKIPASSLVTKVDELTGDLGDVITANPGIITTTSNFKGYASDLLGIPEAELEANPNKVADAAVLYVAQQATAVKNNANTPTNINTFQSILANEADAAASMNLILTESLNVFGGNVLLGTSAAYALMMGFSDKMGYTIPELDTSGVHDGNVAEMGEMLVDTFGAITLMDGFDAKWKEYVDEQITKDMYAFMDAMGTVNSVKGQVKDKLGDADCFNSVANLVASYSEGGIVIIDVTVAADGTLNIVASSDEQN